MKDISKSYINIQGWMVTQLKLSSNDLIIFALIYGFSQDGQSKFNGSLKYLCEWTNCTKPTVMKSLSSLVEKNFIVKQSLENNKVKFNTYKVDLEQLERVFNTGKETLPGGGKETLLGGKETLPGGGKETLPGGGKETLPNNTILDNTILNNTNNTTTPKSEFSEDVIFCYEKCLEFFDEHLRPKTKNISENWKKTIQRLIQKENISSQKIIEITKLAREDDFWSKNFLSLNKLVSKDKNGILYIVVFNERFKSKTGRNYAQHAKNTIEEIKNNPDHFANHLKFQ